MLHLSSSHFDPKQTIHALFIYGCPGLEITREPMSGLSKGATWMIAKPTLSGPRVLLRNPEPRDLTDRLVLGFDPAIVHMFGVDPNLANTIPALAPLTTGSAAAWRAWLANEPHGWVVEHEGHLLGDVRLIATPVDRAPGRAELAISLYDTAKLGLGLGRETIRLVLDHAFRTLELHRVGLRVASYNERAIRCYAACGFIVEGRIREASLIAGERFDDLVMGILASDFHKAAVKSNC